MPLLDSITHKIDLPEGVSANIDGDDVTFSKDGSSISRTFRSSRVSINSVEGQVHVFCDLPRRAHKALAGTWAAHVMAGRPSPAAKSCAPPAAICR